MSNYANFNYCADWNGQDGNVTTVGSNGGPSAYGTYDQSGNVREWNDLTGTAGPFRGLRGGDWANNAFSMSSSFSSNTSYTLFESVISGFRIASALNIFALDNFVIVEDANNLADDTTYGSVGYEYRIGKYPVTNCEYVKFLNSVASSDPYLLSLIHI